MQFEEVISRVRMRCGRPSPQVLSDDAIKVYFNSAMQRLADEIGWLFPDPLPITLEQGVYRYPLPDNVMQVFAVYYGTNPVRQVVPDNYERWVRDNLTVQPTVTGIPTLFAVYGRQLYLNPPPSQGTTDATTALTVTYLAYSPGLEARGIQGLPDGDYDTVIYDASSEFLEFNPGTTPEEVALRTKLAASNAAYYKRHLTATRARWENEASFSQSSISPAYRRAWAAR